MLERKYGQPWIHSALFDLSLIVGPPLIASLIVIFFNQRFPERHAVGPLAWLVLVVGVDVAHVYSSLFRTYLDRSMESRQLLWLVPLACWGVGALLYSMGAPIFWTVLAYVAVFHFVRQQYGFAMIYARGEKKYPSHFKQIDRVAIYAATFYPLLFWHTHLPRNFNWFVEGDFIKISSPLLSIVSGWFYAFVLAAYATKELWIARKYKTFNLPRNLIVLGTAISWYIGIVWLNNDLAFTLTNVVAHGVPYVALIWLYGRKNGTLVVRGRSFFSLRMVPLYVLALMALAYLEEGLWDGFIWRDHVRTFPWFSNLPLLQDSMLLTLLVPILALPQSTHYIFDTFLWRTKGHNSDWKKILKGVRE